MASLFLDCQHCRERFQFDDANDLPEEIFCPKCEKNHPRSSYNVLILCQACNAKLSMPLDIINDDNYCPRCGAIVDQGTLFNSIDSSATIAAASAQNLQKNYDRHLQDGEIFDKYRIIKLLGKGGMAEVYLAEHILLKKQFALKLMRSNMPTDDQVFVKRFLQEAKLLNSVVHRNIVEVFDVGNDFDHGLLFIVMEYVDGKNLLKVLEKHRFSETELWNIMATITNALKTLHAANIIHRDIKPSNIMLSDNGILKLMDLGIAKFAGERSEGEATLTMEQSTIGTPNYASPEQCRNARNVDIRSDIYCLGVSLYHLATGVLPFDGATPIATILNVIHKELEPLDKLRPDLSPEFVTLLNQMIAKNPDDRPVSPEILLNEIRAIRKNQKQQQNEKSWKKSIRSIRHFFHRIRKRIFHKSEKNDRTTNYSVVLKKVSLPETTTSAAPALPARHSTVKKYLRPAILLLILGILIFCFDPLYKKIKGTKSPGLQTIFKRFSAMISSRNTLQNPEKDKITSYHPHLAPPSQLPKHPMRFLQTLANETPSGHYPVVATNNFTDSLITSYDFSQPLNHYFPLQANVQNGLLILNNEAIRNANEQAHIHWGKQDDAKTISIHFRLTGEQRNETILSCLSQSLRSLITMECIDGKLSFHIGSTGKIDTGIELPRNRWIQISFSLNSGNGLFSIFNSTGLLGAYRTNITSSIAAINFGGTNCFRGQVARLDVYADPIDIKQEKTDKFTPFVTFDRRPEPQISDNGFLSNSVFDKINEDYGFFHNETRRNSKPFAVFMLDLNNSASRTIVEQLSSQRALREYIQANFHILALPIASNMKEANTMQYKKLTSVLEQLPEGFKCDVPQLLFFDVNKKYLTVKTFTDTDSLLNIVSNIRSQIDNNTLVSARKNRATTPEKSSPSTPDGTLSAPPIPEPAATPAVTATAPPIPEPDATPDPASPAFKTEIRFDKYSASKRINRDTIFHILTLSYDFAKPLNPFSSLSSKVKSGVLHLNGEKIITRESPTDLYHHDQIFFSRGGNAAMLDFMLTGNSNRDETILTLQRTSYSSKQPRPFITNRLQIKCINGELVIRTPSGTIKTEIELPRNQWINLAIFYSGTRLIIYNGSRMISHIKTQHLLRISNHNTAFFGDKVFFHGKVARFCLGQAIPRTHIRSSEITTTTRRPPVSNADNGFINCGLPYQGSFSDFAKWLIVDITDPKAIKLLSEIVKNRNNIKAERFCIVPISADMDKTNIDFARRTLLSLKRIIHQGKFVYTGPVLLRFAYDEVKSSTPCPDFETFIKAVAEK